MIDRATIDKIMDAVNIVDVVGEFVTLRKAGVNYKGLCPFHDDKTPSFMVSPSKQICHCFACGEGGNAVNFLMKHEQITYPEALRWLAKKYNIEIQEKELTDEEKKEQSDRESMFIVNEWAMGYFQDVLKNDPDGIAIGKQYFRSRGIRDDIIEKFSLGYALTKRDALALTAQKAGYQPEFLIKTGLCYMKGDLLVDRYAGRVIFPWLNVSGKVVAFGGRLLDARTKGVQQKYVNSPDSEIYHKERELYGLFQAKKAIAKEDRVYMVEGYTDVIAMHQCGIENVVANSGTALSNYQIRLLRRFTQNITLLYDGDEAGIHAAMRGTDMLLAEGMNIKVLLLPDGDDPDSFARKHTAQEFKDYIEAHQTDFITFKTQLTVENVSDPVKRSEAIGGIVKSISVIPDQILRSTYLSELSQRMGIKEQTLLNSMNGYIRKDIEEKEKERERGRAVDGVSQSLSQEQGNVDSLQTNSTSQEFIGLHSVDEQTHEVERLLVRSIIRDGEKVIFENVETEDGGTTSLTVAQYIGYDLGQDGLRFHDERYNRILDEAMAHSGDPDFKAETYFMQHPDVELSSLAARLAIDRHQLGKGFQPKEQKGTLRQHVLHLVLDLRLDIIEKRLKDIQLQLRNVGSDMERAKSLLEEYRDTQQLRDALAKQLGNDLVR
ncbi:DNA primase [Prevotella aff. ruminicola Tc2-24]|uniref:DNA primase n=1 Tax=Prevotella aff. ruminicola Tc2-24 TaxID=81582 RepID=A0A1I0P0A4_9BACT|nr:MULTISPECIES: DNA primase [Prevotella]SEE49420.1 DNA primase [Prevotella sp. lc2012]SEW07559.1 DNA primase [Prevotella aff. ruminicola Tc2-24]